MANQFRWRLVNGYNLVNPNSAFFHSNTDCYHPLRVLCCQLVQSYAAHSLEFIMLSAREREVMLLVGRDCRTRTSQNDWKYLTAPSRCTYTTSIGALESVAEQCWPCSPSRSDNQGMVIPAVALGRLRALRPRSGTECGERQCPNYDHSPIPGLSTSRACPRSSSASSTMRPMNRPRLRVRSRSITCCHPSAAG